MGSRWGVGQWQVRPGPGVPLDEIGHAHTTGRLHRSTSASGGTLDVLMVLLAAVPSAFRAVAAAAVVFGHPFSLSTLGRATSSQLDIGAATEGARPACCLAHVIIRAFPGSSDKRARL